MKAERVGQEIKGLILPCSLPRRLETSGGVRKGDGRHEEEMKAGTGEKRRWAWGRGQTACRCSQQGVTCG